MEYVPGTTLDALIRSRMELAEALRVVRGLKVPMDDAPRVCPRQRVRHRAGADHNDTGFSRSLADGPDGMYYLGCPLERNEVSLYRLDPATGRSQVLGMVETGGRPVLGMAVSPDGSAILYSKVLGQAADLMLIENFR